MRRSIVSLLCAGFLLLGFAIAPSVYIADDGVHHIEVGDYWEYQISEFDFEEMDFEFNIKIKVKSTSTMNVGGQNLEVYNLEISGSTDFSQSVEGITMEGSVTISGDEKRLASDFNLVSSSMDMSMSMEAVGTGMDISMEMTMVMESTYDPPIDDYIGDDTLVSGTTVESSSTVSMESTMTFMGETDSDSFEVEESITMEIEETDVTVVTPAGTFDDCYKVIIESEVDGDSDNSTQYYSEEVGNYVKITGESDFLSGMSGGEIFLKSYGHGDGGLASLFSEDNLWIMMIIIIAVIAAIIAIMMARKRRMGPTPLYPQPEGRSMQTPIEPEHKPPPGP